ncbi:MAG: hypothetical protein LBU14_03225 [Candidatus Peribacteria bacterium]|jgi:hypothetical protein|nr:hypothetical protein [Candidatus Peribacteria bacterium]
MTILPDVPLRTDLVLSKSKLEADGNEYATLQVELKDRYNNLVFNNSSTKIDLEISPKYSQIINSDFDSQITKE